MRKGKLSCFTQNRIIPKKTESYVVTGGGTLSVAVRIVNQKTANRDRQNQNGILQFRLKTNYRERLLRLFLNPVPVKIISGLKWTAIIGKLADWLELKVLF